MATWKYYEQTGETGGTTSLIYVDSHNGDDANPGTHLLPKQSLQGGFDTLSVTGAVIVISGYFKESNFISVPASIKIIAEGYCLIDVDGGTFATLVAKSINDLSDDLTNTVDFGFLHIKNGADMTTPQSLRTSYYNCYLEDCYNFTFNSNTFIRFKKCLVKNGFTGQMSNRAYVDECTFFGTVVGSTVLGCHFKSCYLTPSTKIIFGNIAASNLNYNLFQGTLTDKITINGTGYNNTEALQAALPTYAVNDLPSTTNPLFNGMSYADFTPTESSPLLGAGENGVNIGAFNVSIGQAADSANWTLSNIDNTTNPDAAVLDAGGVGTLTANTGIQLFADGSRRVINRISLPGTVIDPEFGETVNSQLSSAAGIPSKYSVEIQYSTDGGSTYNGTWLKVPYGSMPLHDTVNNVGNADPAFVSGGRISATHILPRITLRNNDV